MSWPQWPGGGPPQAGLVTPVAAASVINPAPAVMNPAGIASAGVPYTAEQWAQMQQQNWQQWAQWQQQFQQWQQQYGAQYAKTMSALSAQTPGQPNFPNTAVPPPLPSEKPPLPPEEPPATSTSSTTLSGFTNASSNPLPGYSGNQSGYTGTHTNQPAPAIQPQIYPSASLNHPPPGYQSVPPPVPAPSHSNPTKNERSAYSSTSYDENRSRNVNESWQNRNNSYTQPPPGQQPSFMKPPPISGAGDSNYGNKRPYNQPSNYGDPKKSRHQQNSESWTTQRKDNFNEVVLTSNTSKPNIEELSEAEKKFDKQFAEWEAQFQKWKEQNANHPDKAQYREYEKKWENWRTQLLERREQMRRKRLGLLGDSKLPPNKLNIDNKQQQGSQNQAKSMTSSQLQMQTQPILQTQTGPQVIPGKSLPATKDNYKQNQVDGGPPHPDSNDEPLQFKTEKKSDQPFNIHTTDQSCQKVKEAESDHGFLNQTVSEGIPGLDLVKDGKEEENDHNKQNSSKGPDLAAISKGLDTILGDEKFLNMLNMVSKNQAVKPPATVVVSKVSGNQSQSQGNENENVYSEENSRGQYYEEHSRNSFTDPDLNVRSDNARDVPERFSQQFDPKRKPPSFVPQRGSDNFRPPTNFVPNFDKNSNFDNLNRGPPPLLSNNLNENYNKANNFNEFSGSNFGQGNKTLNSNITGYERNFSNFEGNRSESFGRSPGNFSKEPEDFGNFKGTGNFKKDFGIPEKGPFNFARNSNNFERASDIGRGSNNFQKGFANFEREPNNFGRGPGNFESGGGLLPTPGNFNRSLDRGNFMKGPGHFERGPDNFERYPVNDINSANNYDRGLDKFDKGSLERGLGHLERNFRRSDIKEDSFPRSSNNFGRDPAVFSHDFQGSQGNYRADRFESGIDINVKNQEQFQGQADFDRRSDNYIREDINRKLNFEPPNPISEAIFTDEKPLIKEINTSAVEPLPLIEENIWKPEVLVDYDHKPPKPTEPEIIVEPIYTFDYRHKPLNRIPLPQRPAWLKESVKNYPEFDFIITRPFEPQQLRWYPNEPTRPYDSHRKEDFQYERRRYGDETFDRYSDKRFDDRKDYEDRKLYEKFQDDRKLNEDKRIYTDRRLFDDKKKIEDNFVERKSFERRRNYNDEVSDKYERKSYERDVFNRRAYGSNYDHSDRDKINESSFNEESHFENWSPSPIRDIIPDEIDVKQPSNIDNSTNKNSNVTLIEDLLNPPGRYSRPSRLVIILRGPPGSGKTTLAKMIKDKEVENGGSAPRILSLDDYFMVEQEKEVIEDGRKVKVKDMVYEYEECMEASYRQSLMKSFKKTITDGYFPFIVVDNINDKVKYFGEMWSFAKQNGFQVYICQLELDVQTCTKRNIHGRTQAEIEKIVSGWEPTPCHHPILDATCLIQSSSIPEVEMEEINSPPSVSNEEVQEREFLQENMFRSKWDNLEFSEDNLAKLDGISKPLRPSKTMEDYLQLDDEWMQTTPTKPGQKRVRWADLEERKEQEKMRAIGFVVGHTNWDRMMDPTMGSSALTQTKYIDRVRRY